MATKSLSEGSQSRSEGWQISLDLAAGVDTYIHTSGPEEEMSLKHLCRQCIRKHLLQMSPVNLFVWVPQLGLPTLLQEYLLCNVSLDDNEISPNHYGKMITSEYKYRNSLWGNYWNVNRYMYIPFICNVKCVILQGWFQKEWWPTSEINRRVCFKGTDQK